MIDIHYCGKDLDNLSEDEQQDIAFDEFLNYLITDVDGIKSELRMERDSYRKKTQRLKNKKADKTIIKFYKHIEDMFETALKKIEYVPFPVIPTDHLNCDGMWSYSVKFDSSGITLGLGHYCGFYASGDQIINEADIFLTTKLVEARLLTVNEFAEMREVEPVTVRQWIRRGKLRNAVKLGSEWRIPELTPPENERGYSMAIYTWDVELDGVPKEFDFIKGYNQVIITQDENDKKQYQVHVGSLNHGHDYLMDTKQREKFEYYLISNPFVKTPEPYISSYSWSDDLCKESGKQ